MATYTFGTTAGQTVDRELLIAFLNTGTAQIPVWSVLGTRVEDSSNAYDWQTETIKDILGKTWTTLKKPNVTQSFDPYPLDAGDTALQTLWQLAVVEQNATALAAMDMLIVHAYAGFGERYMGCAVEYASNGGAGGGNIAAGINVTYGGTRITGGASYSNGTVTFTPLWTVTFSMQGFGTQVEPQEVPNGQKATQPTAPTASGKTFGGWYKEAACTNSWVFDTDTVTADTMLYAKWS